MKRFARHWKPVTWVAVAGYVLGILILGTLPQAGGAPSFNDKFLHASVFGGLGGLAMVAFAPFERTESRASLDRAALRALLLAAGVGALLEVVQAFAPGRCADVWDWLADCVGIVPVVAVLRFFWPRFRWGRGCLVWSSGD